MLKNVPNILTVMRVFLIPAIYISLISHTYLGDWCYWLAVGFYTIAGLTDFFDGWLARKLQVQSGFGRMLDPIADKLMVATVLIMLVDNQSLEGVHTIAALIILSREILVSGLREYLIELRVGLPVSNLAKIKTTAQMVSLGFLLAGPAGANFWSIAPQIGLSLLWIAAILTIYTGYAYLRIGMKHAPWSK